MKLDKNIKKCVVMISGLSSKMIVVSSETCLAPVGEV